MKPSPALLKLILVNFGYPIQMKNIAKSFDFSMLRESSLVCQLINILLARQDVFANHAPEKFGYIRRKNTGDAQDEAVTHLESSLGL